MDGRKTIEALKSLSLGSAKDLHEDMRNLAAYLEWFSPTFIKSPIIADFIETYQKDLLLVGESGTIAICKRVEKEILNQSELNVKVSCIVSFENQGLIGDFDGSIHLVDFATLTITESKKLAESRILHISPHSLGFVVGTAGGEVYLVQTNDGLRFKVLTFFEAKLTCMTEKGDFTGYATESGSIIVLDNEFKTVAHIDLDMQISCIRFTKNYIAVAIGSGVRVLDYLNNSEVFLFDSHTDEVLCMTCYEDLLFTGSADGCIKVWTTDVWRDEVTLFGHSAPVKSILIDDLVVHSLDKDGIVRVSRIPSIPNTTNSNLEKKVVRLLPNSKVRKVLAVLENSDIIDLHTSQTIFKSKYPETISIGFTDFLQVLVVFQRNDLKDTHILVTLINLTKEGFMLKELRTSSVPTICTVTEELKLFITGEMLRITIWGADNCDQLYVFCTHNANIRNLFTKNWQLFAGDENGVIKQYNLQKFTEIEKFSETDEQPINFLTVNNKGTNLFSVVGDRTLKVQIISKKLTIFEHHTDETIKQMLLTQDESHLLLVFRKSIEVWNVKSFSKSFTMTFSNRIDTVALDFSQMQIHVVSGKTLKSFDNPFDTKIVTVYGQFANCHLFLEHISNIFKGTPSKYCSQMNSFILEPFHINILHIYAYFNMKSHLEQAIKAGTPFFPSKLGYDPLAICIKKYHTDSLSVIINSYLPYLQEHPQLFYYFGRHLIRLNHLSPQNLHLLYSYGFKKSDDNSVPHFCKGSVKLPIFLESFDLMLNPKDFMPIELYDGEDQAVDFYNSFFKVNTVTGSSDSLDFVKSLIECKNLEIFSTLFIKSTINYKWGKVRWLHYLDFLLYLTYMAFLILGAVSHKVHYLLIVSFCINQLLLVYEFVQVISSPKIYFSSVVNYLDILRGVLFNVYCAFEYFNYLEYYHNLLFLCTLLLSILRAFGYFRVFKATRWLLHLMLEIVIQLSSFLVVTLYIVSALWVLNFALMNTIDLEILDTLKLNVMLFLFILVINPLIIINLFITVVGNALEKVHDERNVKDAQDVCELIFEAECLMVWRRGLKRNSFMHLCVTEQEVIVNSNSLSEKIRVAAEKTEAIKNYFGKNGEEMEKLKETLDESFYEIETRVNEFVYRI